MTNSDFDSRLDRIEAVSLQNVEAIAGLQSVTQEQGQQIATLYRVMDRLTDLTEQNLQQLGQTMQSVERLANAQTDIAEAVDSLANAQTDIAEALGSINAAVERFDRLMDYLIRRDGERSGES